MWYGKRGIANNLLGSYLRGRLQRTSGKWGGGVVLKFRTFPEGGVVCESSDIRKFLKKSKFQNFSEFFKVKTRNYNSSIYMTASYEELVKSGKKLEKVMHLSS